jgi:hypothetical protein
MDLVPVSGALGVRVTGTPDRSDDQAAVRFRGAQKKAATLVRVAFRTVSVNVVELHGRHHEHHSVQAHPSE